MATPIRTRTRTRTPDSDRDRDRDRDHDRRPRTPRLPPRITVSDDHLVGLIDDTRNALARCMKSDEKRLARALIALEIECVSRGLVPDGWTEHAFPDVLQYRLMMAIETGDSKRIGRLAGELSSAGLIATFEEIATLEDDNARFLGASAVCLALETHISGWDAAEDAAAEYMVEALDVAERLRRVERRWGFLLGILSAAGGDG